MSARAQYDVVVTPIVWRPTADHIDNGQPCMHATPALNWSSLTLAQVNASHCAVHAAAGVHGSNDTVKTMWGAHDGPWDEIRAGRGKLDGQTPRARCHSSTVSKHGTEVCAQSQVCGQSCVIVGNSWIKLQTFGFSQGSTVTRQSANRSELRGLGLPALSRPMPRSCCCNSRMVYFGSLGGAWTVADSSESQHACMLLNIPETCTRDSNSARC
jgi:hypothetical protein